MSEHDSKRAFAARPSDAEAWVRRPESPPSRDAQPSLYTARLTIDVTPGQRGRIKVADGEIEIAEILDTEFGNALIAAEVGAKILDEFCRILRDTHVDGAGELLPHAVVARGGRRPLVCRVPLDNENSTLEALVVGQIPSCGRTHAGPADDDYIVVFS
jgi:hypothetical protein